MQTTGGSIVSSIDMWGMGTQLEIIHTHLVHTVFHRNAHMIRDVVFHLVKIGKCQFTKGAVITAAAHCASL